MEEIGDVERDSTDLFFVDLGERLIASEGADAELANILISHLLKATIAQNAVAQAKDAILKLAVERAKPPALEVVNG